MTARSDIVMETGGFCVGPYPWLCLVVAWGFGVLEISPEELVLDTTWKRYRFTHSSIVRLLPLGLIWGPGLRIEHSVPEYPRYLAFKEFHIERVFGHLKDAGYTVDDKRPNQAMQRTAARSAF